LAAADDMPAIEKVPEPMR